MGTTMPPLEVGKRGKKRAAELRVRPDAGKCGKGHTQQTTDSVGPVSTLESVKSCAPKVAKRFDFGIGGKLRTESRRKRFDFGIGGRAHR